MMYCVGSFNAHHKKPAECEPDCKGEHRYDASVTLFGLSLCSECAEKATTRADFLMSRYPISQRPSAWNVYRFLYAKEPAYPKTTEPQ